MKHIISLWFIVLVHILNGQDLLNKWGNIEKWGWKEHKDEYWIDYYSNDSSLVSLRYDSLNRLINTRTYFPDGKIIPYYDSTLIIPNYKKSGTFVEFYEDKSVKSIENYYLNTPIGSWYYYYSNGKIKRIENYPIDSLINKLCSNYSIIIHDLIVGTAINLKSLPHGDFIEYYDNGQIKVKKTFNLGLATGIWTWYYPDGHKMKEGGFYNKYNFFPCEIDTLIIEESNDNYEELMATDDIIQLQPKHGIWKYWNKEGELINVVEFNKGEKKKK